MSDDDQNYPASLYRAMAMAGQFQKRSDAPVVPADHSQQVSVAMDLIPRLRDAEKPVIQNPPPASNPPIY